MKKNMGYLFAGVQNGRCIECNKSINTHYANTHEGKCEDCYYGLIGGETIEEDWSE